MQLQEMENSEVLWDTDTDIRMNWRECWHINADKQEECRSIEKWEKISTVISTVGSRYSEPLNSEDSPYSEFFMETNIQNVK